MAVVIDTSAIIAVIINEPERAGIVSATRGKTLLGPGSIPWETGNAFSAMFKRHRITLEQALLAFQSFESVPLRYVDPDFQNVLEISRKAEIYAYDAYFIDCALRKNAPLLTLDKKLQRIAHDFNVALVEV